MDEHIAPTRFALILIGVFAGGRRDPRDDRPLRRAGHHGPSAHAPRSACAWRSAPASGSILSLIIGQGLRLSIGGIVLGVIAAIALTRVMASLLVGVTATDPATFAAMAVLFTLVAAIAAWIPARRAAGLNPNVALRDE